MFEPLTVSGKIKCEVLAYFSGLSHCSNQEIWFDDVDPEDIEMVTGKKVNINQESSQAKLVSGGFDG